MQFGDMDREHNGYYQLIFSTVATWLPGHEAWFYGTVTEVITHDVASITVRISFMGIATRHYLSKSLFVQSEEDIQAKPLKAELWAILNPGDGKKWQQGLVMDVYMVQASVVLNVSVEIQQFFEL